MRSASPTISPRQEGGCTLTLPPASASDTSLEAVASVAGDLEPPPARGGAHRVEQRGLDEHLGGRLGAAGRLAADDPAEALHAVVVGDRSYLPVELVFAAVQGEQPFAGP